MSDLRSILKEEYKKKEEVVVTPQSLIEMIEQLYDAIEPEVMGAVAPLMEEEARGSSTPQKLTIDLIPTIPISEIGWGSLVTPEKGGAEVRTQSGQQLAQYLNNIAPGGNIKVKIAALKKYYDNPIPDPTGSPKEQLQHTISNLVFYKTLTNIITNFNASAAGFAFESFLAVLLDAETGKQIPATATGKESTIADIVLFQGSRPISLKLYKEGSLSVGGSYKQLVEDLTGKYPTMEYIVVTKDLKESKDPLKQQGKLNFYAFNFTNQNLVEIMALQGSEGLELMQIPGQLYKAPIPQLEKLMQDGSLEKALRVPTRREVPLGPLMDNFVSAVQAEMTKAGIEDDVVASFENEFNNIIDRETGQIKNTKNTFAYGQSLRFPVRLGQAMRSNIAFASPEHSTLVGNLMDQGYAQAISQRKELSKKGSARKEKFKELSFATKKQSLKRLSELQQGATPELYNFVLKHTNGYLREKRFELTKGNLGNLKSIQAQNDLYPYGSWELGSIEIGAQKIQKMLDDSINSFNEAIFSIFTDLKDLSGHLNKYVAGGLKDDGLAQEAEKEAGEIGSKTKEVRTGGKDSEPQAELPFGE